MTYILDSEYPQTGLYIVKPVPYRPNKYRVYWSNFPAEYDVEIAAEYGGCVFDTEQAAISALRERFGARITIQLQPE